MRSEGYYIINPRCACVAWVTVVVWCVCLSGHAILAVCTIKSITKDTIVLSVRFAAILILKRRFSLKLSYSKVRVFLLTSAGEAIFSALKRKLVNKHVIIIYLITLPPPPHLTHLTTSFPPHTLPLHYHTPHHSLTPTHSHLSHITLNPHPHTSHFDPSPSQFTPPPTHHTSPITHYTLTLTPHILTPHHHSSPLPPHITLHPSHITLSPSHLTF